MLQIWETGGWHSRWTEFGRVVYGPFGLIHDGLPNGYQYWDESTNQPVSRGETYPVKNGLNEWTIIGDLQVGQINAIEGIGVFDGSKLRLIRAGYSILVNVYRSGENVTISFIDDQKQGFIIQITMGELRLLPEVQIAPAPPAPTPSPVPPVIQPTPKEVPSVSVPNQLKTVEQIRAKYPTPLGPNILSSWWKSHQLLVGNFSARIPGRTLRLPPGRMSLRISLSMDPQGWIFSKMERESPSPSGE
jgi:hypothetical protein